MYSFIQPISSKTEHNYFPTKKKSNNFHWKVWSIETIQTGSTSGGNELQTTPKMWRIVQHDVGIHKVGKTLWVDFAKVIN